MKTTTVDTASDFAHETVEKIVNATNQATEALDEKSEQLMKAERQMVKKCSSYVQDNPVTSIGIAVAGGFLLSRLLSGR